MHQGPGSAGEQAAATSGVQGQLRGQHELLRPPQPRYSSHTTNLACQARVAKAAIPAGWTWGRNNTTSDAPCTCRLPRTSVLCRLLVAMIALLVFIQAISCGLFFCVTLPFGHRPYLDYRDLITEIDPGITASAAGGATAAAASSTATTAAVSSGLARNLQATVPKLIPRVIHQTYRSKHVPAAARQLMRSWQLVNGNSWQVRFYHDEACLSFVRREFPEYLEAFMSLPKDVERADFFRYMVVLRLGGVAADMDVECKQPLDSVITAADTLLVGWDSELADTQLAAQHSFARQRQVATWFFAAAPGHPVLRDLCDHIARNARTVFSNNTVRDTQERTGQGIWTDLVLQHALDHPAARHDDPWKVRILPRVAFGVHPASAADAPPDLLSPDLPGVVVLHHFLGSWQQQGSWQRQVPTHRKALQILSPLLPFRRPDVGEEPLEPVQPGNISHYPVSISFNPPFTMMTNLVGSGDQQSAADVSAAVTAHGTWQPGIAPYRRPAVVEALVGALSRHNSASNNSPIATSPGAVGTGAASATHSTAAAGTGRTMRAPSAAAAAAGDVQMATASAAQVAAAAQQLMHQRGVLVDVGAGHGFFSLAAAARGHKVVAFETSPGSLAAFRASIAYNGFGNLIEVRDHQVLGATPGKVCLQQQQQQQQQQEGSEVEAATHRGPDRVKGASGGSSSGSEDSAAAGVGRSAAAASSNSSNSGRTAVGESTQHRLLRQELLLRRRRGYPYLSDGPLATVAEDSSNAGSSSSSSSSDCAIIGERVLLSDVLGSNTGIAALRLSVHGHEGWVLQGALHYLTSVHRPEVVYVEFCPAAMKAAGYHQPQLLLQQLFALGYTDIAHAGRACDQRWLNATAVLRSQGTFTPTAQVALAAQPTWCKLRPEAFQLLVAHADTKEPENVLFVLGSAPNDLGVQHGSSSGNSEANASTSDAAAAAAAGHRSADASNSSNSTRQPLLLDTQTTGAAGSSSMASVLAAAVSAVHAPAAEQSQQQASAGQPETAGAHRLAYLGALPSG